ncbi:MAG: hypothetical protein KF754_02895 [Planctomycetes bacterium]|nr:hypothetical protein [Planctomycetota bacterium]
MGDDPNFRLKAFAVITCVLGVFLVSFVAQRVYYWARTRRREDVETTRVAPILDFSLLALGAFVIWLAIEALVLAISTARLTTQPDSLQKIAEIEVGKLDRDTNQTNLLFYPVDRAGRRQAEQRRPILTSGDHFHLTAQITQWRSMWAWLGEGGFYQFLALGGFDNVGGGATEATSLDPSPLPRGLGRVVFLRAEQAWEVKQACKEGEVYDILIDPQRNALVVQMHK